jgi:hypothetical protein
MKQEEPPATTDGASDRAAVMERRKEVSARVSETTRFIGFGLLAIFYAMISDSDAFFVDMRVRWPLLLRLIALSGALAVLLDYLHYVFAYLSADRALERTDAPDQFGQEWLTYRLETWCFWAKQAAATVGCGLLIFLVAQSFG